MHLGTRTYQKLVFYAVISDVLAALVAYTGAFVLRIYVPMPFTTDVLPFRRFFEVDHYFLSLLLGQVGFLYFFGCYDRAMFGRSRDRMITLPVACALQTIVVASLYFFRGDPMFPRSVLLVYWVLNTGLVAGVRETLLRRAFTGGARRIVLVGCRGDVAKLLAGLGQAADLRSEYEICGWITIDGQPGGEMMPVPCLGTLADVLDARIRISSEEVLIISEETWKDRLLDVLNHPRDERDVSIVPSRYEIAVGRLGSLQLGDIPLNEVKRRPEEDLRFLIKAVLDRVFALLLLLFASPVLAGVSVLIKLSSGGPIFYTQVRVGKGRRPFVIRKFRTMALDAEADGAARLASPRDPRLTWIGRWLRASHIDELPQLLNVLDGTMSLVGPRPERPEFVERFLKDIPGYSERFRIKPGLTGLAQLYGGYHTAPAYKLKYDIAYIYHYSLLLDMKIFFQSVKMIWPAGRSESR